MWVLVDSSTVEKAKFEYSPLGEFFNKGLNEEGKKEELLKRLKNIKDKNEGQLKAIKGKTDIKSQIDLFSKDFSSEAVALLKEIKDIGDNVDNDKLLFTGGNKKDYSFKNVKTLEKLIKIYNGNMTIDKVEIKQNEFSQKIGELRAYPARGSKYIELKESVF